MKLSGSRTLQERFERKQEWHRWFAWRPVRVGKNDCRWLERVERRGTFYDYEPLGSFWDWEYRAP